MPLHEFMKPRCLNESQISCIYMQASYRLALAKRLPHAAS